MTTRFRRRPSETGTLGAAGPEHGHRKQRHAQKNRACAGNHRGPTGSAQLNAALLVQRLPLRAFLFVFLLVFLADAWAALRDRRAVAFFVGFAVDSLTVFFAGVFLLAFAARFKGARFLRGA